MQSYFVLLLVAVASATPLHHNLLKHNPNNSPVLNLNHKNVHLTHQVVAQQVVPQVYSVPQYQVVPQVYTAQVEKKQVVPQVYSVVEKEVPQIYTAQIAEKPVVQQVYTHQQVVPQVYTHQQVVPQVYTVVNKPVVPQVYTIVETPALTSGYVAATHGSVHTAPLPKGPSGDGLFASHHINLPKA